MWTCGVVKRSDEGCSLDTRTALIMRSKCDNLLWSSVILIRLDVAFVIVYWQQASQKTSITDLHTSWLFSDIDSLFIHNKKCDARCDTNRFCHCVKKKQPQKLGRSFRQQPEQMPGYFSGNDVYDPLLRHIGVTWRFWSERCCRQM